MEFVDNATLDNYRQWIKDVNNVDLDLIVQIATDEKAERKRIKHIAKVAEFKRQLDIDEDLRRDIHDWLCEL